MSISSRATHTETVSPSISDIMVPLLRLRVASASTRVRMHTVEMCTYDVEGHKGNLHALGS